MINTVYVIAGPTATGKSDLSISLAKKVNGAVINSDSMQVYKNLSILTARPTTEEMNNVEHSLYGYVDGGKRYNVEKWCKDASKVIEESFEKNTTPILVGGTGLYINTLINGIINIPSIPEEIKIESEKILTKFGKDFLINQIKNIDPDSLNEININDNVRLRRIWEVFETFLPSGYQLLSSCHSKYSENPFSTIYSVARKLKNGSNSFNSNPYSIG